MRYIAFISYRHRERDQKISSLLRRGLENHRLPVSCPLRGKRRAFRDTDELPTSIDLGMDIENALKDSEWLVALCSEEYVASRWCMREIEETIAAGRKERILPVLVSGTPETAVPEAIRDLPAAGDLRGLEGRELKRAAQALTASLLSRMSGTEEMQIIAAQRRFRFLTAAGIFASLAAAVFGFALYAVRTADVIARNNDSIRLATEQARQEEATALEERNNALSRRADYYAEQAWEAIGGEDLPRAVKLALEALPENLHGDEPVSGNAVNALRMALNQPARTRDEYVMTRQVETAFTVTGFRAVDIGDSVGHAGADKLTLTTDGEELYTLTLSTGEITQMNGQLLARAADRGYSKAFQPLRNRMDSILYGRDRQMANDQSYYGLLPYNLNGEPFYADHVVQNEGGSLLLAWLADPQPGQIPHAAVFRMPDNHSVKDNGKGAVCELQTETVIRSAFFPGMSGSDPFVLDEEGTIRLYDGATGKVRREMKGSYTFISGLKNTASAVLAADAEGTGHLIDMIGLEEVYTLHAPARILQLWYCERKDCVLACCEDGIRLYNMQDGRLLAEMLTEESPVAAAWGGYDPYMYMHEGDKIVILYEHRAEVLSLNSESDPLISDALVLYVNGQTVRCRTAFYDPTGENLYLESSVGVLMKWDAETGELLWSNENHWIESSSSYEAPKLSLDGTALWRTASNTVGYDRIDAETGETVFSNTLFQSVNISGVKESPDGSLAMCGTEYSKDLCVFDAKTGEELWKQKDLSDSPVFSDDSREILLLKTETDKAAWADRYTWMRLDARTGEVLEQKVLLEHPDLIADTYFDESSRQALVAYQDDMAAWVVSLADGSVREYAIPAEAMEGRDTFSAGISCEGRPYIECYPWNGTDDPGVVIELMADGTTGPALARDSMEGHRLMTHENYYVRFGGREARRETLTQNGLHCCRLISLDDGEILLEIRMNENFGLAVSPRQDSVCIYGAERPPVIIRITDTDTLVEKARKLTGGTPE